MRAPRYTRTEGIPAATGQPRAGGGASASAWGAGGAALAAAGDALGRVAEAAQAEEEREVERTAALDAARKVSEFRLSWLERSQAAEDAAPVGAAGYRQTLERDFDRNAAQWLQAADAAQRPYLESRITAVREQVLTRAWEFERNAQAAKRLDDLNGALTAHVNAARIDASVLAAAIGEGEAAIGASALPDAKKVAARQAFRANIVAATLRGMNESRPELSRVALETGELAGVDIDRALSPEQKNALVNDNAIELRRREAAAEAAAKEAQTQARAQLRLDLADEIAALREGGTTRRVDEARVRRVYADDPAAAERIVGQLRDERAFGLALKDVGLNSPGEDAALMARLAPEGGGYAAEAERRDVLARALAHKRDWLARDPAGYVLANAPGVRGAFEAARAEPKALAPALARLEETQARLGVPPAARRYLGADAAKGLVADLARRPAEEAADRVEALATQYGGYWPAVYRELADAGLPGSYRVLATVDDPVARKELAAAIQAGPELRKSLPEETARAIDADLPPKLEELRLSLAYAPDGPQRMAEYLDAARRLAYRFAGRQDAADAVEAAVEAVALGRYDFVGQADGTAARAPRGQGGVVEDFAAATIDALEASALADPGGEPQLTPEQRQARVLGAARRGVWVTDESDDGWFLVYQNGRPVTRADGTRVGFKFADMRRAPAPEVSTAPATGVSP